MKIRHVIAALLIVLSTVGVLTVFTEKSDAKSLIQYSRSIKYSTSTKCLPNVLKQRLNQIRRKFGPIKIVSTLRRGARIRGSGRPSKHATCRAVDFKVKNRVAVFRWLNKNHKGGVGLYHGRCRHIHIDNGANLRWIKKSC